MFPFQEIIPGVKPPAIIVRRKIAAALIALVASCGFALAVGGDGINNPGSSGGGSTTITINSTPIVGCGTPGGALYNGSNLVQCSAGVTMSDTALSLGSGVTLTAPDTGTWTSAGIAIKAAGSVTTPALSLTNFETGTGLYVTAVAKLGIAVSGTLRADYGITTGGTWMFSGSVRNSGSFISTSNVGSLQVRNGGSIISSSANAAWQLGTQDAATAVAQTLQVQNIVAGTSNGNAANWTLIGSLPTGTGTPGDFIIQTSGTGAAATVQNSAVTALTIKGGTQQINAAGILNPATAFAPSAGSGAASVSGNDQRFVVTTGAAQTSITVNFGHTWGAAPVCTVSSNSTASVVDITSTTGSAITFGASVALTGGLLNVLCFGA